MTIAKLIEQFFLTTPNAFGFLCRGTSGAVSTELRHLTDAGFVDCTPEAVSGWFSALWRFEGRDLRVEVSFGDRELVVAVKASPTCHPLEFALWEWAQVKGSSSFGFSRACDSPERLETELRQWATLLESMAPRIAAATSADLALLRQASEKRLESRRADEREQEHERARARADEAFRRGDFDNVQKQLDPFLDLLSPAERLKLVIARRNSGR